MPYVDWTSAGWTETDPASKLTVGANQVTAQDLERGDADTYLHRDYGAAHFGDGTDHRIWWRSTENAYEGARIACWELSNTVDDINAIAAANAQCIGLDFYYGGTVELAALRIIDFEDDTTDAGSFTRLTQYYLKILRSGTTYTCYVYDDEALTSLVDSFFTAVASGRTYQHLFSVNKSVGVGIADTSMVINNLNINEAAGATVPRMMYSYRRRRTS